MFAALAVLLLVLGAILRFAIRDAFDGVDLATIGNILMAGGVLCLVIAAIQAAGWMSRSPKRFTTERHASPDGGHVIEETRTN